MVLTHYWHIIGLGEPATKEGAREGAKVGAKVGDRSKCWPAVQCGPGRSLAAWTKNKFLEVCATHGFFLDGCAG